MMSQYTRLLLNISLGFIWRELNVIIFEDKRLDVDDLCRRILLFYNDYHFINHIVPKIRQPKPLEVAEVATGFLMGRLRMVYVQWVLSFSSILFTALNSK